MKKQIKRLSPHQNGKVFGILMALSSLVLILPIIAMMSVMPQVDQHGNPVHLPAITLLLMPLFYLIFGYISVAVGCLFYNFLVKYIGGIEFELEDKDA